MSLESLSFCLRRRRFQLKDVFRGFLIYVAIIIDDEMLLWGGAVIYERIDLLLLGCALVGASKWEVLASFLLEDHEIQEIKEKSENYKVCLLAVLKSWARKEPFQRTVGKLLKWCKEAGVCKREIVKKYETLFAYC